MITTEFQFSELAGLAKSGCKQCRGRGYLGTRVDSGAPVVCPCVVKEIARLEKAGAFAEEPKP